MTERVITDRPSDGGDRQAGIGSSADGGNSADDPTPRTDGEFDRDLRAWMDRCRELALSKLDSVETPSRELADLAAGNRLLMEHAYRMLRCALELEPGNSTLTQMMWFWRRAFEKGTWDWDNDPPDPHRYLS